MLQFTSVFMLLDGLIRILSIYHLFGTLGSENPGNIGINVFLLSRKLLLALGIASGLGIISKVFQRGCDLKAQ